MTASSVPEYVLIEVRQLPQLVADLFPLVDQDVCELLSQIFDYFLNVNSMDPNGFRLDPQRLCLHCYEPKDNEDYPQQLALLAHNVFSAVFNELIRLGFQSVVNIQQGWYYVFDRLQPSGYHVLLRNISPQILNTQKRYEPALYP